MRYANYDEMEDAIRDEYKERIQQLEEETVNLYKEIDELKADVNYAEAETDRQEREGKKWKKLALSYYRYRKIFEREYPEVFKAVLIIKRLGESK